MMQTQPHLGLAVPLLALQLVVLSSLQWSLAEARYFQGGPTVQVSGISAQYTFAETVIIIDRADAINTYARLDNGDVSSYPFPRTTFGKRLLVGCTWTPVNWQLSAFIVSASPFLAACIR